jgi:hypothetical protein
MSDCSKRKFKELDTRKKFKRNYINKEEIQLRYRDKKCKDDSWHDDKKDFCCDKKDDCKRKKKENTVIEFDVSQSTPTTGTLVNGTTGLSGINPANTRLLDQVKVHVNDEDNDVLIQATVEWTPDDLDLFALLFVILLLTDLTVPLSVQATFRVFRSEDHHNNGPLVPIFETTDTAPLAGIELLALLTSLIFGTTTTSFHFVDKDPSCGKNRYYLTMEVSVFAAGTFTPGGGVLTPIIDLLFPDGIIGFATDTHVLTAMEITNED